MQKVLQTIRLDWGDVATLVGQMISEILGWRVMCVALFDDYDYWSASAVSVPFSISELNQLLDYVDADEDMRDSTIPEDKDETANLDMRLSRALLQKKMGRTWQEEHITTDGLWLLGVDPDSPGQEDRPANIISIAGLKVDLDSLWPKEELVKKLFEAGGTESDLSELCERYVKQYGNELCWTYPITDGEYNGVFFVLVREGVLCLPYDEIDKDEYEIFERDGVRLVTAEEMRYFTEDWLRMSNELMSAMNSFRTYLNWREKNESET